jgi:hypothetical protein
MAPDDPSMYAGPQMSVEAGDGDAAPAPAQQAPMAMDARMTAPMPAAMAKPKAAQSAKELENSKSDDLGGDQLLIFTGQIQMLVDKGELAKSIDEIVDAAVELGGYVSKQDDRSVTVRVPSKHFRSAMREMEEVGEVLHRGVQAQDVSEEFHDLGVRLKSLLATRSRLEQFLTRAKTIPEVLRVEQELSRLNGEIDRIQGRLRFLEARASFSTITVTLDARPDTPKQIIEDHAPPPPAQPRTVPLPIDWLSSVGIDSLMNLR